MRTVLTIAGFDPSSGAGVTADLTVFAAHGLFGTACITALTVQSTLGVESSHAVEWRIVADTLACLDADLRPDGIKIGMLGSSSNIRIICEYIDTFHLMDDGIAKWNGMVVLDPVLRSSSGRELLDAEGLKVLQDELLPRVDWITPNTDELELLAGVSVRRREDVPAACRRLQELVGRGINRKTLGILATGGHLEQPDDYLLTPGGEDAWLAGEHVETRSTHGTGCAFSSAFLSRLVQGDGPSEAAAGAKSYVVRALKTAEPIGHGRGPMNLLVRT